MLFALANCCKGAKIKINISFSKTPFIFKHSAICNFSNKTRLQNGKCGYLFTYIKPMNIAHEVQIQQNIFEIDPLFDYRNIHV